jgi:3-hydroxyisobutyrate dehydrogenase-like beta-hydroxyacid dehydrogenase
MAQANLRLAFLGLGVMGFPMAGHLLKTGNSVCVFNRNADKSQKWLEQYAPQGKAERALSIEEACQQADVIFTCVGNDDDLKEVMLSSSGVFRSAKKGALICDHTTSSAKLARKLSEEAKQKGLDFVDAPVSGGQAGAENGSLSIMLGGEQSDYEKLLPLLESYGKTIALIGGSGSGQLAKMVNQICIAGILEGLSEALYFGDKAGLDLGKVLSVIGGGAAQSWQMDNRAKTMLKDEFDFGFAVDWMRKDLAFVLDEAKELEVGLPLVEQVDNYYEEVQGLGGGRWDTSSLITRLAKNNEKN